MRVGERRGEENDHSWPSIVSRLESRDQPRSIFGSLEAPFVYQPRGNGETCSDTLWTRLGLLVGLDEDLSDSDLQRHAPM